jgi:hypothetical protein
VTLPIGLRRRVAQGGDARADQQQVVSRLGTGRNRIEVVEVRAEDIQPGDVVNKAGHVRNGWIEVATVDHLPDGRVNIADPSYQKSFTSEPLDLIWLQIVRPLQGNSHLALPG